MKKNTFSFLFALCSLFTFSQVGLVENFDSGLGLPPGWTGVGYFGSVAEVCDVFSQRDQLNAASTTGNLTSPNVAGQSNGTDVTITFDYKIVDWSAATDATPPGWGELLVQYSTDDGGVWTTILTIDDTNHITSNLCANMTVTVPAANVPNGSDFKLQFVGNWAAGDYYVYIDNVTATQVVTGPPLCTTLISPTNGETGVDINANLEWNQAVNIPTGYVLSVGTTPGGTEVVDNEDVGLATTYDLPTLNYSTMYYVTIIPYNVNGNAVGCVEENFETAADPNAPVDCASGIPINTVFCYDNNDTTQFSFISSDGSPLFVVFNSGTTENNFDELIVLDSDGVTNINAATPYGNAGNLSGLMFTSTGDTITVGVTSDGSVTSCTNDPWNFDVFCVDTTALPNCDSILTSPVNGEVDVNENIDITWSAATILVTGYTISMGTTPGGTDIANSVDVGNNLTYDPGTLPYDTTIYVTIIPYNDNGDATGCVEESFEVRSDPNQIVDCSIDEVINTIYCYTNDDTQQFNFSSSDGSQLVVVFNSGTTENNFDELVVLDSDGVTDLNAATPYGNLGDLTGLIFTSTGNTITVGVTSDGSVISCTADPWDFDVFCLDTTALPNCNSTLTNPINGATGVNENTTIDWTQATVFVTGYTISIGTTPGGTEVADNVDVGNVLTYTPGTLASGQIYYVTIVPYNTNGDAIGCIEENFTVRTLPNPPVGVTCTTGESSFVFTADFDDVDGWTGDINGGDGTWEIPNDSGTFNTGADVAFSGDSFMNYEASGGTVATASAVTPVIDLTNATDNAELSFYMHAFGEDMGTLNVGVGTSATGPFTNEYSWSGEFHDAGADPWTPIGINLDAYLGQAIFIEFSHTGTGDFEGDMSIDFVRVEACGSFCITPAGITVTATTDTTAEISWTANSGEDAWEYVVLPAGSPPPTGAGTPITTNPTTIMGLTASTDYDIYIRAECGINDYSLWGGPASFTTEIAPIDCDSGVPLNINFCYENNETTTWVFTSTTGFPLNILFNEGEIAFFGGDFITIYDGPNNTSPILFQGNNGGDLTGLTATSTGDSMFLEVSSDGFISCATGGLTPWDFDVWCQTCMPQSVDYNIIGDCDNQEFTIEIDVTSLGDANTISISDNQGSPTQTIDTQGVITFGPYIANTEVIISTINDDDGNCTTVSDILTLICAPPPNDCSIVYAGDDLITDCGIDTDLTAVYMVYGSDPDLYDINVISDCPTPLLTGGTPTSIDVDDTWSDVIDLGFEFCFFGDTYSQILIGSNGVLSFNTTLAGGFNAWAINPEDTLPNNTVASLAEANIFGVAHDIDPSVCGDINYFILGAAPERQFVVNYSNVCHFQCNDIQSTSQIILYESSNNIDINIIDKPTCDTWNDGNAVVGVQNNAGTIAFTPPGRNTGVWDASNESWRFSPGGAPSYTFEWFDGTTSLGNTETITVSPTVPTTYTATVTYTQCDGTTNTVTDEVFVDVTDVPGDASFTMAATCDGGTADITGDAGGTFALNPDPGDGTLVDAATGEVTGGTAGTTYTVEYTTTGACPATSIQTVTVLPAEDASFTLTATCDGATATVTGDAGGTFALNPDPGDGTVVDAATGEVTGGTAGTTYTVEYITTGACPATSIQTVTVLPAEDASFTLTATCDGATATVTGDAGGTFALNPDPGDGTVVDAATGEITGGTGGINYTIEYTTNGVCPATSMQTVTVLAEEDANFTITPTCDGGIATLAGDAGGTFALNPDPGDGVDIDTMTGEVFGGISGATYTVDYTTSGPCPQTSTVTFTALIDIFDFTVAEECINDIFTLIIVPVDNTFDVNSATFTLYDDMNTPINSNVGDNTFQILPVNFNPPTGVFNYVVEVTNAAGCTVTKELLIENVDCVFPQAISPNADGYNDYFDLSKFDVQRLEIYNRYGVLVYEKDNYTNEWNGFSMDGDDLPTGTYFYVMRYQQNKERSAWVYINK